MIILTENDRDFPDRSTHDSAPIQFSLRFLFRLTTIAAVLLACLNVGGPSGMIFAISAIGFIASIWTGRKGR
jgi:hypothetical protein